MEQNKKCSKRNSNNMIAGIILIICGVFFLVKDYINIDFNVLWPVLIIAVGVWIIYKNVDKNKTQQNQ